MAECGVKQSYQANNLGKILLESLSEEVDELVFRTTNPSMKKAITKAYGKDLETLFMDPVETEREWYGVKRK